ncbi:MAG: hypothetical protein NZ703_07750 [Gemmataceae bacterium]|nr:hypothetical protein [Gemmataceae bacterium]
MRIELWCSESNLCKEQSNPGHQRPLGDRRTDGQRLDWAVVAVLQPVEWRAGVQDVPAVPNGNGEHPPQLLDSSSKLTIQAA